MNDVQSGHFAAADGGASFVYVYDTVVQSLLKSVHEGGIAVKHQINNLHLRSKYIEEDKSNKSLL